MNGNIQALDSNCINFLTPGKEASLFLHGETRIRRHMKNDILKDCSKYFITEKIIIRH